jgi:hypothetical protein
VRNEEELQRVKEGRNSLKESEGRVPGLIIYLVGIAI